MSLRQTVTIPAGVTRLVFAGRLQIKTAETDSSRYDQLDVALEDAQNSWSFHVWDNSDATNGWAPFEIESVDYLNAQRGRPLTFVAETITDSNKVTSFWLDSLSLVAECARQ